MGSSEESKARPSILGQYLKVFVDKIVRCIIYFLIGLILPSIDQGLLDQDAAEAMSHENQRSPLPILSVASDGLKKLVCLVGKRCLTAAIDRRRIIYVKRYSCVRVFFGQIVPSPESTILGPGIQRMCFVVFAFGIQTVNQDDTVNDIFSMLAPILI